MPVEVIIVGGLGIGLLVGTIVIMSVVADALKRTLPRMLNARADRLERGGDSAPQVASERALPGDVQRRLGVVDDLARRLAELEERVDFAERLLAQQRDATRVAPPQS